MKYLNLGCGQRFHPSWTNINFISTGETVIAHDLRQGIPFQDQSFDVVYHSHVLEHIPKAEAELFIKECYRVLRPKGILRIVVPDLEQIARIYLDCLEKANINSQELDQNYQWVLLEMYDQTVRNQTGGEMINFLSRQDLYSKDFIVSRCGVEIQNIITAQKYKYLPSPTTENLMVKLIKYIYRLLKYRDYRHQELLKLILSTAELDALKIGQFRQSGEVHQWMYDRYSLSILLKNCGLAEITKRNAYESFIDEWTKFYLDTEPDGSVYKPDSLYIEAVKPVV
ncbi:MULTISPECIES: class I SAM-dependent methyltransferase [Pseudanabaena]|jgi:ubiquinone/menaquinone biosynthesis C-methylase UbiE|uniref:class I SAM-dependent methyltransferase n=1 Tax=Pseudanabaena TaxID=1152 RepID=UPI00247A4B1E|nr:MULTISPECIES: methyltransferase domain-containing protein [Pseudanabaena]MEA5487296.1 methyltransferase domain-containing protein [Pseudanabaena sp. CCNP1317]WGS70513.1 methyltransferase domain-containing protein [Pseudanabaena galeata CCNP1313]